MTTLFSAQTRLLVVAPHPDDETIATGVLIQQVLAAGGAVKVLLLTNGDNNPWPQRWLERRVRIRSADRMRWARRRRDELRQAMACLGLGAEALTALGWADQGLTRRVQRRCGRSVARLREVLAAFAPNLIAMPSLADRHPDHSAAHVLMRLAMAAEKITAPCLLYRVHGAALGAAAELVRPREKDMLERKSKALACHVSQLALSGGRMRRLADGTERFEWLESEKGKGVTVLPWHPPAAAGRWLSLTAAAGSGGAEWRWRHAPVARTAQGDYALAFPGAAGGSPRFAKLQLALPSPWIFDYWGWCELAS